MRTPIVHRATIFLQDFFTIDNTRPLAIIFFHQNKRPSPIKGPLLKIRLQDPLNVLRENSSPVHYWCAYGSWKSIKLVVSYIFFRFWYIPMCYKKNFLFRSDPRRTTFVRAFYTKFVRRRNNHQKSALQL